MILCFASKDLPGIEARVQSDRSFKQIIHERVMASYMWVQI